MDSTREASCAQPALRCMVLFPLPGGCLWLDECRKPICSQVSSLYVRPSHPHPAPETFLSTSPVLAFPVVCSILSLAAFWSGLSEDRGYIFSHHSWPWRHRHIPNPPNRQSGQCRVLREVTLLVQDWAEHPRPPLIRAPRSWSADQGERKHSVSQCSPEQLSL